MSHDPVDEITDGAQTVCSGDGAAGNTPRLRLEAVEEVRTAT